MKMPKRRFRVWIMVTAAMVLTAALNVTAFAADDIEDEVYYIGAYDESGDTISAGVAYLIEDEDGNEVVLAMPYALDDDAAIYVLWDWEGENYTIINPGDEIDGLGCVTFSFENEDDMPSSRYFKKMVSAERNEILTMLYVDEDYDVQSAYFQVTGGEEVSVDSETEVALEGTFVDEDGDACEEPEDMYYVPVLFMNEDGDAVAVLSDTSDILAFDTDLSAVSGGYSISNLCWILIAVIVGVFVRFIFKGRKKGGEAGDQAQQVSPVADDPLARPIQPIADNSFEEPIRPIADDPLIQLEPIPEDGGFPRPSDIDPIAVQPLGSGSVSVTGMSGVMAGRTYPVNNSGISFGRDVSSGIRFAADVKGVSRNHCKLFKDSSGALLLMDCGSTYGTFLQGYGKLSPQQPVRVQDGAVFFLGSEKNSFVIHMM